jgi:DNA-binding response OmpR family regulator
VRRIHFNLMNIMVQNKKFSVAVVEDEGDLRNDLLEFFRMKGVSVVGFASAEALYADWANHVFDLVILDIGLPGENGLQVAQWLRSRGTVGIVMLTALGSQSDQVVGLEAGADAYLVKNASMEVIEATCHSVLRRLSASAPVAKAFVTGTTWLLDDKRWILTSPKGDVIALTHSENIMLRFLFLYEGLPVNRIVLLDAMSKSNSIANIRNLDSCASRLRRKVLQESGLEIPIRPSYGSGYTFTGDGHIKGA